MAKSKEETEAANVPEIPTPVETIVPEIPTMDEAMKAAAASAPTKRFLVETNIWYKGENRLKGSEIELTRAEYNKISQFVTLIHEDN